MLYHLLYPLRDIFFGFNVFRYITFRAAMSSITAFVLSITLGPLVIKRLTKLKIGELIEARSCPPLYILHKQKEGTPTFGGVLIITAIVLSTLLWARLDNSFVLLLLLSVIWLGVVGFVDDYLKVVKKKPLGLSITTKLLGQFLLGLIVGVIAFYDERIGPTLSIPFCKDLFINLGLFYLPFVILVIVSCSNSVNLTDGLDGLAIGCVIIVASAYGVLSYATGHIKFSEYLKIFYNPGAGELTVFCAGIAGASLGFLWFNCHPASIFMGDTGSLALGGAIGVVAVLIKKELLLFLVGGIFVMEALSVVLQIISYKFRGKRIFLVAPLHHHFQLRGWPESKVIIRFWIVAIILALFSLITLKLQ
jgi:phospho-N-acetylmuramoyl-pentapeptide-transferase